MNIPPRIEPGSHLPPDPAVGVATSHRDATVYDIEPPPEPSGPSRAPLVLLAILIGLIVLGGVFWWMQSQQSTQATAAATATAVTQATMTAAQQNAANAQATAAAQSAVAAGQSAAAATQQAAAASQATTTAQQAAVVAGTATAQTAAAAQAGATAEAITAQATAAAQAARNAPTATPVVMVVTATPIPAPAKPAPEKPQGVVPAPPAAPGKPQAPAPTAIQLPASPQAIQSSSDGTVVRATTAPGRPTQLRCLGEKVTMMAEADALPPQVTLSCGPVDPSSVPPPPNPIVNGTLFRLEVAPADGNNLRGRVDLRITYPPDAVPSTDRSKLVLGYLDGSTWTIQPDQTAEPSNNTISAKVDRAGVYALYPRP